ncbi:MAG: alpha/beta hydrolase [Clostridia bacterium]|nr:alpha/beta hydrolase [Clostridia bacterium]
MIWTILYVLILAFVLMGLLPALLGWFMIFGRHRETAMKDFKAEGTYYEPYADEMLAAEKQLLADPGLRRVETVSDDGINLCADLLHDGEEKAVILVHGFTTAPSKNFAVVTKTYREAGYAVLMVHLRCHGPSSGTHNALGAVEWRDVLAWVNWCQANLACCHLILHGASMGAVAVGCSASYLENTNVKALVLDSGFNSPWKQLQQQGRRFFVPTLLTLPLLNVLVRKFSGADLRNNVPDALRVTKVPALFIHGTEDSTVPIRVGWANYESCTSQKQFLEVKGAEHTLALIAGGAKVRNQLMEFVDCQINAVNE